jgi:hypothetical protein
MHLLKHAPRLRSLTLVVKLHHVKQAVNDHIFVLRGALYQLSWAVSNLILFAWCSGWVQR